GLRPPVKHAGLGSGDQSSGTSPDKRAVGLGPGGGSSTTAIALGASLAALALAIVVALLAMAREVGDPVGELARAFARTGRPVRTGVTLARVEQRLASWPEAAAYVRSLRLARFASRPQALSLRQ